MLTVLNWASSTGLIINGVKEIIIMAEKLQSLEMSDQNGLVWPDTMNQGSSVKSSQRHALGDTGRSHGACAEVDWVSNITKRQRVQQVWP